MFEFKLLYRLRCVRPSMFFDLRILSGVCASLLYSHYTQVWADGGLYIVWVVWVVLAAVFGLVQRPFLQVVGFHLRNFLYHNNNLSSIITFKTSTLTFRLPCGDRLIWGSLESYFNTVTAESIPIWAEYFPVAEVRFEQEHEMTFLDQFSQRNLAWVSRREEVFWLLMIVIKWHQCIFSMIEAEREGCLAIVLETCQIPGPLQHYLYQQL